MIYRIAINYDWFLQNISIYSIRPHLHAWPWIFTLCSRKNFASQLRHVSGQNEYDELSEDPPDPKISFSAQILR